ncbi:Hypothetical predicted protein [Scomber scombrus]|uniref:Uncharacterized protein n=1 Tax=Scomber scombrus TaxID=13677 RepID=A0AAV1Q0W5_SCOSC
MALPAPMPAPAPVYSSKLCDASTLQVPPPKLCQVLNNQRLLGAAFGTFLEKLRSVLYCQDIEPPPEHPSWYGNVSLLAGRKADAGTGAAACHAGISARLSAPR